MVARPLRSSWGVTAVAAIAASLLVLVQALAPTGATTTLPGSVGGEELLVGDLDRNGRPEVIIRDGPFVTTLTDAQARGLEGFEVAGSERSRTEHLVLSDVDGDGDQDLYGAAGALLSAGTTLVASTQWEGGWWMGDLDGDLQADRVDLRNGRLLIQQSNQPGSAPPQEIELADNPLKVIVAQVDGLAGPEIMVLNGPPGEQDDGPTNDGSSPIPGLENLPIDPGALLGNGSAGDSVTVLVRSPGGLVGEGWVRYDCPLGPDPVDLGFIDVDGDKLVDLIGLERGSATLTVRQGGTIADVAANPFAALKSLSCQLFPVKLQWRTLGGAVALTTGDFDGDGLGDVATLHQPFLDPDPIAASFVTSSVQLWFGSGVDGLRIGPTYTIDGVATDIEAADLDQDGAEELTVLTTEEVVVLRNDGEGGYAPTDGPGAQPYLALVPAAMSVTLVLLVLWAGAPKVRRRRRRRR